MAELSVPQNSFRNFIAANAVSVAAVAGILMMIIPLPTFLLDLFMVLNLGTAIILFLTVISTPRPSRLTTFPQIILFQTLFGLALNVSSTRLILTKGENFDGAMIRAFSSFVVGGSNAGTQGIVVGMVIFIILIVIQVAVVTRGATRVSEVAARFALDSMAQKSFAVDQELNSGAITEEEARAKRAEIRGESDFFSAMDGSSKFVSGNVIAGIFITVINLVAGLITGMVLRGEQFQNAISTYSRLTIGDGLLSQIPSLLLSYSTGLLVTANNSENQLAADLKEQFTKSGVAYIIGGVAIAAIGLVPGMPIFILFPLGGACAYAGYRMWYRKNIEEKERFEAQSAAEVQGSSAAPGEISPVVPLDPLLLEIGYALIPLVEKEKGAKLLERVTRIRREAALDLGLVVPSIRIMDNMQLDPSEYSFKIRGIEAGKSRLRMGCYMAINTGSVTDDIKGEPTKEPAFGMDAIWVSEDRRAEAENAGFAVVDPPTVIATHITEIIRSHAYEILGRKEVKQIIDKISETNKVLVDEVLDTAKFTYGQIEKVLQNLLREQVSIRNMELILETLANYGSNVAAWILTEKVRVTLAKQICRQYADDQHILRVMNLAQDYAELLDENKVIPADGSTPYVALGLVDARKWISDLSASIAAVQERGYQPIVLCPTEEIRLLVKSSTEREIPGLVVLSVNEIMAAGNSVSVEVLGEIKPLE